MIRTYLWKMVKLILRNKLIVVVLICLLLYIIYIQILHESKTDSESNDASSFNTYRVASLSIQLAEHQAELTLSNSNGKKVLAAKLGKNFGGVVGYKTNEPHNDREIRFGIPDVAEARVTMFKHLGADCFNVSWTATRCKSDVFMDCFDLGTAHWYGGGELKKQYWPLEKVDLLLTPFIAGGVYGPVQERLFFNSDGGGIFVDEDIPLFVSINATGDRKLCLQARLDNYWYSGDITPELKYTLCSADNVRNIHRVMTNKFISKPSSMPNPSVFRYPIWSTWVQYKDKITQDIVLDFANDIKKYGFSISQIEIDDGWSKVFGEMVFNSDTFPNPLYLTKVLHSRNISVTLWVHPFINAQTNTFSYLAQKKWMMMDKSGKRPALTSWHKHFAGHLDFSNTDAAEWFLNQLESLKTKFGFDSFKFDAGDVNLLPPLFQAKQNFLNRNHYGRLYVLTGQKADTEQKRLEFRTGIRTQHIPAFLRLLDRYSTWTVESRGLQSVITTALQFGILGYPFLLPDYIGGNCLHNPFPDQELFIRWIQANALLPVMQFSLAPWKSNSSVVIEVAREMVKLHEQYSDLIVSLAEEAVHTGHPIIRPLWWIAPTDILTLTVDDQFLLGDSLMVAPVLEQGQTNRRIYLPVGRWRDELKGTEFVGEQWLNYAVTLRDLPHFTRLK